MQQIYRRTAMPKCDFIKSEFTLRHECSPLNLLHILRTPFPKNNSGRLLLKSKSEKSNCDVMRHFMISFLEKLKQKYKNFSLLQKNILSAKKNQQSPFIQSFLAMQTPTCNLPYVNFIVPFAQILEFQVQFSTLIYTEFSYF